MALCEEEENWGSGDARGDDKPVEAVAEKHCLAVVRNEVGYELDVVAGWAWEDSNKWLHWLSLGDPGCVEEDGCIAQESVGDAVEGNRVGVG